MKKKFISLCTLFIIGAIVTIILVGDIYYNDREVYKDYKKVMLNNEFLENISIESDIDVCIYTTYDKPYIELSQTFIDYIRLIPTYKVEVEVKEENTLISVKCTNKMYYFPPSEENEVKVNIYLPKETLNKLSIRSSGKKVKQIKQHQVMIQDINTKYLEANIDNVRLDISGKHEKVRVEGRGTLIFNSSGNNETFILGNINSTLQGEFTELTLQKVRNNTVNIQTDNKASIKMNATHCKVNLKGEYESVRLGGSANTVHLNTSNVCRVITGGEKNNMTLNGPIISTVLDESRSNIEIQTTIIPRNIHLSSEAEHNTLDVILPSNIGGLTIKCMDSGKSRGLGSIQLLEEYNIISDFKLIRKENRDGTISYQYKNGEVVFVVNKRRDNRINIIDDGYSSRYKYKFNLKEE